MAVKEYEVELSDELALIEDKLATLEKTLDVDSFMCKLDEYERGLLEAKFDCLRALKQIVSMEYITAVKNVHTDGRV